MQIPGVRGGMVMEKIDSRITQAKSECRPSQLDQEKHTIVFYTFSSWTAANCERSLILNG